jgi:hypothetical protein
LRGATALLAVVAALFAPAAAEAAYPGENGLIAFERQTYNSDLAKYVSDIWIKPTYGFDEEKDMTNLTESPGSSDIDPAWNASGDTIAFASDRDGDFDIYLMSKNGVITGKVTNGPGQEIHPTWSSDGSEIAFESPNPDGGGGIWIAQVNSSLPIRPLRPTGARQPAWSPDGTRIAYVTDRISPGHEPEAGYLHVVNAGDGSNDVQISDLPASNPDWAPDGSEIAFSANDYIYWYDLSEIYAIKPDGTGTRNVSNHHDNYYDDDLEPAWSPDGTKIAEHRGYSDSVYFYHFTWLGVMDAGGSGPEQRIGPFHDGTVTDSDPSWQPAGEGQDPFTRPYPRPSSATPLKVPLVPAYSECTAPNSEHVAPLALAACSPPTGTSPLVTMSPLGRGRGSVLLKAIPGDPDTSADEADIAISARATDVVCATGQAPGCPGPASDYSGQLLLRLGFRITGYGSPFADTPGTVQDYVLPSPFNCYPTPGAAGSTCALDTTIDALIPGFPKEGALTVMSLLSVEVLDMGADGRFTYGSGCPPYDCGSGDENTFLTEGLFTP